jgi:hypothetical protein
MMLSRFSTLKIIEAVLQRTQRARKVVLVEVVPTAADQVEVGVDFLTRIRLHLQKIQTRKIESRATTETRLK